MSKIPDPKPRAGALTKKEREFFSILQHNASKLALVRTEFDGKPAAALAMIWNQEDGGGTIVPVAILVDSKMFKLLKDPAEAS